VGYRLGVDLGTTFTAAAVDDGTGPTMLGLGNRALTVPSVVYVAPDGGFLFGEAADRRATREPVRAAREFKRRIGDTVPILLAGQPFSPQALSAKLLAWVVSVATERQGQAPDQVVVAYPANWGGYKRELLTQVTTLADLSHALTCTEPEAAATQYAARAPLATGDTVAVYDLGGGTFDVCILQKQDTGFTILGSPDGVEHLGGIDFDEAVLQHVVTHLSDRMRSLHLDDPVVTDALTKLRRECVEAKEALSGDVETTIDVHLPGITTSIRLTRPELEELIAGPLQDTLDATHRALRSAGVEASDLATVVLVGGSSRIPLVSHLLQSEFGVRTAMDTHPKHDVALGAVRFHPPASGEVAPPAADTVAREPSHKAPVAPVPEPATAQPGARRPSRPLVMGAGAAMALVLAAVATYLLVRDGDQNAESEDPSGSTTPPTAGGRVLPEDTLLVPIREGDDADAQLVAVSTGGQGQVDFSPLEGFDYDAPWFSRDGAFMGYRVGQPGSAGEGPWRNMVMTADRETSPLFSSPPPEGVTCNLRVAWEPEGSGVLLNCIDDANGDGDRESSLYRGAAAGDGTIDGSQLEPALHDDDPTQDRRNGSPGSTIKATSFLPSGAIAVQYDGGEEPGIHVLEGDGPPRRLTSGTHDDYAVASPVLPYVTFVRDGDLYVVSDGDNPPPCPAPREREDDAVTGAPMCNMTLDSTTLPDQIALFPSWSWDGGHIAFEVGVEDGPSTLRLVSLSDPGDPTILIEEPELLGPIAWGPR